MPFLAASSLFPFVFFGFVIIMIITAAQRQKHRVNEAWALLAKRLGLEHTNTKGANPKRILRGSYRGFPVKINTFTQKANNSRSTHTRYRVKYPNLGLDLELKQQHFLANVGRALSGGQDIVVGDKEFDDGVIVAANSEDAIVRFLTPNRRMTINAFINDHRRATVRDGESSFITNSVTSNADQMRRHLDKLVDLAEAMVGQRDPSPAHVLASVKNDDYNVASRLVGSLEVAQTSEPVEIPQVQETASSLQERFEQERKAVETQRPTFPDPIRVQINEVERLEGPEVSPTTVEAPLAFEVPAEPEVTAASEVPEVVGAAGVVDHATPTPALDADIDYETLRTELFGTSMMSYEVKKVFDERYAGRRPQWSGVLKRVSRYSSDLQFKDGAGAKVVIELAPIQDGSFSKDVKATVQIELSAEAEAKARIGEVVSFSGTLLGCDGFMRNLVLAHGQLL